jgi:hypothetical protein
MAVLSFHPHDLNLGKSSNFVKRKGNYLRFKKSGTKKSEECYAMLGSIVLLAKSANKASQSDLRKLSYFLQKHAKK